MKLYEWAFLVPEVRNSDRQLHPSRAWLRLQQALEERFGGFTGPEGPWPGNEPEGEIESSYRFRVAIPKERADDLRNLLRELKELFDQERFYLKGPDGHVELI